MLGCARRCFCAGVSQRVLDVVPFDGVRNLYSSNIASSFFPATISELDAAPRPQSFRFLVPYYQRAFSQTSFAAEGLAIESRPNPSTAQCSKNDVATSILRQISVRRLCEHLKQESDARLTLPRAELLQFIKEFGVAQTEDEANRVIEALSLSGIIISYENKIYLKPDEVADIVIRALPDTESEANVRIPSVICA
jgi:hypothetical protein